MSIDLDCIDTCTFVEWLESETAQEVQRTLEAKIVQLLFKDPEKSDFQQMIVQLAWVGSSPDQRAFLEKEIIALNLSEIERCGFWKNSWNAAQKIGRFVANHALEIGFGVALCATGIGIAAATGYSLSACIGGVVVAGAGSVTDHLFKEHEVPKVPSGPSSCTQSEWEALQQNASSIAANVQLPSSASEILITADGAWVNGQYFSTSHLMQHSPFGAKLVEPGYSQSDWRTFAYYKSLSEQQISISCQDRGKTALALGDYKNAAQAVDTALATNPTDRDLQLIKATSLFGLSKYEEAVQAYQPLQTQANPSASILEFTLGFASGVPKGAYESGEGLVLFFADMIRHPIQTSERVFESFSTLVNLAKREEWSTIAETLSPELSKLLTQWDTLSSTERGELAGYALGKHGADILAPGAIGKIASKSARSMEELVEVCKNLQIAQETLILETAAGIGSGIKIEEIISVGKRTVSLGEELGFTPQQMGQLQQAGKLEATVHKTCEQLSPAMRESYDFFGRAEDFLKPYRNFMPEEFAKELIAQTGVKTFPRPKGIPENFRVQISAKGAGIKYVHPKHKHTYIRVMPGKPHSPNLHQQKPYVNQIRDGQALDKFGNIVKTDSPEAHIPYEEFVFRN